MSAHRKETLGVVITVAVAAIVVAIVVVSRNSSTVSTKELQEKIQVTDQKITSLEKEIKDQSEILAAIPAQLDALALDIQAMKLKSRRPASSVAALDLEDPGVRRQLKTAMDTIRSEDAEDRMREVREFTSQHMQQASNRQLNRYATELELSENQKEEMQQILEEASVSRRELTSNLFSGGRNNRVNFHDMSEKMKSITENTDAKVQEILSAEQLETYRKMSNQRMGNASISTHVTDGTGNTIDNEQGTAIINLIGGLLTIDGDGVQMTIGE